MATLNILYASDESELEELLLTPTELKADVGSRSGSKNALATNTPVDVIVSEQIEKTGLTSLVDVIRYFVAGFNAPEFSSMADGSDHVRAYTLRGMNPDQILVLVNGKRVRTSALLHVNGTIGRGSSNVDLDTISVNSIEKIEILRDGAAAQYGSDAIAGVINIILKGLGHKNSVSAHSGIRGHGDGATFGADTFVSLPMKYDGFTNFAFSAETKGYTDNSGIDSRAGVTPVRNTTKLGTPELQNYKAALNLELPQDNDVILYSNAILNYRDSKATAFYRAPSVYSASGFLPSITTNILDFSAAIGAKGSLEELFEWDVSHVYGVSNIKFFVKDSMNYSLGSTSPTSFYNGAIQFSQNTTNLDIRKKLGLLALAGGLEHRYENYKIEAGDPASYSGIVGVESGAQGLKGFRPESATDENRNSYALYIDAKYLLGDKASIDAATRFERFSDFGSTGNYKLSFGYKPTSDILFRSSASTGFRAPSLAQSNYSFISTYTSGGSLQLGGTFKPTSDIAKAFGAKELKPETSKHLAFGTVYQSSKNSTLTIDFFYTLVDDKIMLSNSFTATGATAAQQAALTAAGVSSVNFFTNAVNTRTQGVDVKFDHKFEFEGGNAYKFGAWYNYNDNKVVKFNDPNFNRTNFFREVDKIENGQPKHSAKIINSYSAGKLDTTVNINWFGPYKDVPPSSTVAYNFEPTTTIDMDVSYKLSKSILLAIGGNNIFNTMPSKWNRTTAVNKIYASDGILPYSLYSPIGHSGAYYYARATIKF